MRILLSIRNYILCCIAGLVFLASICSSCTGTRKITYMQGAFDTARLSQIQFTDPLIQKGDILSIIVYSDNPQATALYNQSLITMSSGSNAGSQGGTSSIGASPSSPGYLVDERGDIEFQGLGTLHVEGLTRKSLKDTLSARLNEGILKHPYFNIRFLNYKFTMLGELTRPGVFSIPGEHISILEALGLAGDITVYGRRDNVLIVREVDGKRQFGRLDLTKPEIMGSPYFYLQQNDIVIVEPNKAKAVTTDQTTRTISIVSAVITTLAVIVSLLRR